MMPRPLPTDPGVRGADFRQYVHNALGGARAHAECAQRMAEIGDDDALLFHVECVAGAARLAAEVAAEVAADLRKAKLMALARKARAIRDTQEEGARA